MGEVAIECLAAQEALYSPFVRYVKNILSLLFRLYGKAGFPLGTHSGESRLGRPRDAYTFGNSRYARGVLSVAEVGILIIDDDVVSQRALKNVLDSEGWRVRIVPLASHALGEIASGMWSLVIVNVSLTDVRGPIFTTLKELAQGQADAPEDAEVDTTRPKRIRVLFLVPLLAAKHAQPVLEQEGLPYSLKPYHLNEFLEKVGDLLVEAGAIETPIRSMDFSVRKKKRGGARSARDKRTGAMFASREDYQMSEEEMIDFERQEEEDRKKREKEQRDREHL